MGVEEIKRGIASLSHDEQGEGSAFLFHLRHAADHGYQEQVETRLSDRNPARWLTPEKFEQQLGQQ